MKILITENKQRQLAYNMLDDELNKLTRKDINLNKESVLSNWQVLFIDDDGNIEMRWNEKYGTLYVSSKFVIPLRLFSFDDEELNRLITWWFTNRIRLEPEDMYIVSPGSLDWENMGLEGLMVEF
jgi:hypothetical protein